MPFPCPPRALSVLASALAAAGLGLAVADCSQVTPLGPGPAPVHLPPARHLGSPITVQVLRKQAPTAAGRCPAGSVDLFGLQPNVPRASAVHVVLPRPVQGSTATPAPTATLPRPARPPVGVACYRPVGAPVTVTSAAVSSVSTYRNQPGPAFYGFVVAFPAADVAALTAIAQRAQAAGDATSISVAGKLWQAPQPQQQVIALRAVQITLLSRNQAVQLYRLLVPSG
jgi:hypothetical protein